MRKVLLFTALLLAMPAMGQRVQLNNNSKCDAVSQVRLIQKKQAKKTLGNCAPDSQG